MKIIRLLLLTPLFLFAVDNQKLIDCYNIFAQKKAELQAQAENILEQQEAFEALKNTYLALIKKKESKLKKMQQELNATKQQIENEKKQIQQLIAKNQQILKAIKEAKLDKLSESYAKMRPKNAAQILSNMPQKDALDILQKLQPKILAKIFAKMDPQTAAKLSEALLNTNSKDKNESTAAP